MADCVTGIGNGVNVANCGSNVVFNIGCCDGEGSGSGDGGGILSDITAVCTNGVVDISWASTIDDLTFDVYRGTDIIGSTDQTTYTDDAPGATTNTYKVCISDPTNTALDGICLSSDPVPNCEASSSALTLTAVCNGDGTVTLTWTDSGATNYTLTDDTTSLYGGPNLNFVDSPVDPQATITYTITDDLANTDSVTIDLSTECPTDCSGASQQFTPADWLYVQQNISFSNYTCGAGRQTWGKLTNSNITSTEEYCVQSVDVQVSASGRWNNGPPDNYTPRTIIVNVGVGGNVQQLRFGDYQLLDNRTRDGWVYVYFCDVVKTASFGGARGYVTIDVTIDTDGDYTPGYATESIVVNGILYVAP